MKVFSLIGIIVGSLGLSLVAQGQTACGPTQMFESKIEIGNGITSFYRPGVRAAGEWTHAFVTESNFDAVCRYLGRSTSQGIETTRLDRGITFVRVDADNSWVMNPDKSTNLLIDVIHCK